MSNPTHSGGLPALRRFRIVLAVLCFVAALVAFVDFNNLTPQVLKHAVTSLQFVPSALSFASGVAAWHLLSFACIAILLLTLLVGRIYCSVICPFGILQDVISRISAMVTRKPAYKLPYKKEQRVLRHAILAVTIIAIVAGFGGIALAWLDPYSNFGRIGSTVFRPVAVFINNVAASIATAAGSPAAVPKVNVAWAAAGALIPPLVILVVLIVMAAKRGRLWCNTICPVGTLLGLVSRRSLWRISIDKTACRKCGDCLRVCKAQCIDLRAAEIDFSRCVACYDCVSVCDEHGIRYRWHGLAAKRKQSYEVVSRGKLSVIPPSIAKPPVRPPNGNRRAFITTAMLGTLSFAGIASTVAVSRKLAQNSDGPGNGRREHGQGQGGHDFSKLDQPGVVAPPGGASTTHMLDQCTACQLCISACPSHVLEPAVLQYGTFGGMMKPRMNFDRGFCNFDCTICSEVCPDGALLPLTTEIKHTTRIGLAHTAHPRCIVIRDGTSCGACAEHCPTAALQMKKVPNHAEAVPVVDPRYCIGCGACQYACPAQPKAIVVDGNTIHEKAEVLIQEKATAPTDEEFPF